MGLVKEGSLQADPAGGLSDLRKEEIRILMGKAQKGWKVAEVDRDVMGPAETGLRRRGRRELNS